MDHYRVVDEELDILDREAQPRLDREGLGERLSHDLPNLAIWLKLTRPVMER
ncbi:MAG: hypothetical protein IJK78_15300 [Bacteroidales bacterium]|nr:hypothetical protein [Bacteroidales bacterium]